MPARKLEDYLEGYSADSSWRVAMETTTQQDTSVEALAWISSDWAGSLGDQVVEEFWSTPRLGCIENKVRLSNAEAIVMIELMTIRETTGEDGQATLTLELRQFDAALTLLTNQRMKLDALGETSVAFVAEGEGKLAGLAYSLTDPDTMRIDVTVPGGQVITATVQRV